jgi:hypothetical protein
MKHIKIYESFQVDEAQSTFIWLKGKDLHKIKPGTKITLRNSAAKNNAFAQYAGTVEKCKEKDCTLVKLDKNYKKVQDYYGTKFDINADGKDYSGTLETYDSFK